MAPTQREIEDRKEVDRLRTETRASETDDLIFQIGENARERDLAMLARESNRETEMTEQNGVPMGPTSEQVQEAQRQLSAIEPTVRAIIQNNIRGLITGFPGVQPHAVMAMVSFETANYIGQALQGDIATIAQIRKSYKDAFDEGMRKAPIVPPPGGLMMPAGRG